MTETKKPAGKVVGHGYANDAMPHDLVVAVVTSVSGVAAKTVADIVRDKIRTPSTPAAKPPSRKKKSK